MSILALSGYAQSGKNTVARRLVEHGFKPFAFADPIRAALYALNPYANTAPGHRVRFLVDVHGWDDAKTMHPEIRTMLQRLGTEMGRELWGADFWIERTFAAIPANTLAVITDCRFPNEADAVRAAGGQVWRIERPGVGPANGHSSETALDDYPFFDATVVNDTDVDALHMDVDYFLAAEAWGHR